MTMAAEKAQRAYDIVVWGATGFTGRLVLEYLVKNYPQGGALRWAAAARDEKKLSRVLQEIAGPAHKIPIIIADSENIPSLRSMVTSTRVILTTVGPYAKYGSGLVEACAENGTHYCDLSGEPQWMRRMIDSYQATAAQTGARIVHSCGFDSIPSDFGVWFMQREAIRLHGHPCKQIRMLVRVMKGGASGGTIASMTQAMDEARSDRNVARILVDPYALNPEGERKGPDRRDQTGVVFDDDAGSWTAPFVMAGINTKIVRRSHALSGYPYGRDFRYSEAMMTGAGPAGWSKASMLTAGLGAFMFANSFQLTRSTLVKMLVPKPGEGPSRTERENGFFKLNFFGRLADGSLMRTSVTGDRDPGYGSTSKMLSESAVCLARDALHVDGGFWTPVSAMGESLFRRLIEKAGLTFELE
ncbi:MAG: saccharopine dehydrogenase NADP-binding domain-containing protein [Gammaproteobacteria bacterium]|nr:saccharopine dehydrogenase NADP-binding domain-containing protein [Gammaproteobacteria bacterium]MDH4314551.1 saccharopine dehydrogenase NADP-binding domain-containing protein [Gammaproteobacteria bacterium]MDH5213764.1 saccharopine dehydrogenase NADP-binding domain-containing protein [Gammaproteobacteria bacterium]